MPESGVRVALLGRAGEAREQLRRALSEAGAEVVAEGDPSQIDPGTVASRQPGVVVVSLEPAIEDALVPFDDLLAMPGVQVIYDDAEVTSQLDGWDLARWARHLAAKLAGSAAVLPPPPADSERMPEVQVAADMPAIDPTDIQLGAPPTPAQEMDHHRLEDYAAESLDLSEWVPATPSLTDVEVEPSPDAASAAEEPSLDLELDLDLDLAGLEEAMAAPVPDATPPPVADEMSFDPALELAPESALDMPEPSLETATEPDLDMALEPSPDLSLEDDAGAASASADDETDLGAFLDLSVTDSFRQPEESAGLGAASGEEPLLVDFDLPEGPVSFSSFSGDDDLHLAGVDDDVAALAAQLDANEADTRHQEVREPDFARVVEDSPRSGGASSLSLDEPARGSPAPAAGAGKAAPSLDFGNLELAPMDGPTSAPAGRPAPPPNEPPKIDFGGLSLVDDDTLPNPSAKKTPAVAPTPDLSALSLEDDPPPVKPAFAPAPAAAHGGGAARRGALLVLAGLGGPDGVRQLLSALPAELPVPVLLYQHLDTGKHDRLVGQLAKASKLPVDLAVPGQVVQAGRVAVLPPGVGVEARGDGFGFVAGSTLPALVSALPAADSAVLVLSGGDPGVVPAVQKLKSAGGHVFAQEPSSCFDAVAPQALVAAGAVTAPVAGLASQITDCWS